MDNITKYLFKDENSGNNAFTIHERRWTTGIQFPPHWHDYLELEILISGTMEHNYNNTSYICEPGSAYILSYHDFHGVRFLSDAVLYCIQFNNNFLDHKLTQYLQTNGILYHFSAEELARVLLQINEIYDETNSTLPFNDLFVKTILSDIILRMLRGTMKQKIPSSPLPIQQIIAYIADNYRKRITLDDIAHKFAFSTAYLGQLFKKQTGYTFNEYLNLSRLKHACNLLQHSEMTVKEISYQSGYSSVEYFVYTFKKQLQMTPTEYRRLFQSIP